MDIKYIWKTKEATCFAEYKFWDLLLNSLEDQNLKPNGVSVNTCYSSEVQYMCRSQPEAPKTAKKKMVLFIGSLLSPKFP